MTEAATRTWQHSVFRALQEGDVRQVAYVPDAGHAYVIRQAIADPNIHDILLTTEEEGVGVVAGAWLGGQRAVLLMQSSGVGNCVNMLSFLSTCQIPFLTLVTMRGEYGEFNPWQCPMGLATEPALELMGVRVTRVDDPKDVGDSLGAAMDSTFLAGGRNAVLLGQRMLGRKRW